MLYKQNRTMSKSGKILKKYVNDEHEHLFDDNYSYKMCFNMQQCFKTMKPKQKKSKTKVDSFSPNLQVQDTSTSGTFSGRRAARVERRRRMNDGFIDEPILKKIKTVNIKVNDNFIEPIYLDKIRKSTYYVTVSKLLDLSSTYKYPYKKLKLKQQVSRIDDACKIITSMYIDSNELKNNEISYIHNNEKLAHDVMNVMNGMRSRLESLF
jgi:hypothetical protein